MANLYRCGGGVTKLFIQKLYTNIEYNFTTTVTTSGECTSGTKFYIPNEAKALSINDMSMSDSVFGSFTICGIKKGTVDEETIYDSKVAAPSSVPYISKLILEEYKDVYIYLYAVGEANKQNRIAGEAYINGLTLFF